MIFRRNLNYRDRTIRMIGGGLLAGYALARRGSPAVNDILFTLGMAVTMEGLHGY